MTPEKLRPFDPKRFLSTNAKGKNIMAFRTKQTIFVQGDSSKSVFYLRRGKVRLTVVSKGGKEATIGILNEGNFFGESCLAGIALRPCSAIAMSDCSVMRIEEKSMMTVLHREAEFCEMFVEYLLNKNIRYEEDLVDQLFNSSEKRLARLLLLLGRFGEDGKTEASVARISHETLAEMVGTTRARVTVFMNKFRKLGFIHYNGGLKIYRTLLTLFSKPR
jgi:CRP/FNR family cyclic AMP-dependent transcriptional regulator